ncbi:MAG TPA: prolyl oligopeptidase family serine peptidase [Telluria sp.]|jgi:dipeptidyl aminopeptidase/acylaminoacyl peptidase
MLRRSPLSFFALCAALSCAAPVLAQAPVPAPTDAKPAIASFFEHPVLGKAALSPSARYLAVRAGAANRHDFLVVIELATNKPTIVASFDDSDIAEFQWVNDERLLFNVTEKNAGQGNILHAPGLFAVDRDGKNFVQLADLYHGQMTRSEMLGQIPMQPWNTFMMAQRPHKDDKDDTTWVINPVFDTGGEQRYANLIRLNTRTGKSEVAGRPPGPVHSWWLDHDGEPRLAGATREDMTTLYYREPASGEWRILASFKAFTGSKGAFSPVGFGPDGTLYVVAQHGQDTQGLYTFDLKAGKISAEPVLVTKGFDFDGTLITGHGKVLGTLFTTDAMSIEWFDPAMKALQAKLDKLLPATVNLVSVPASESPWVMVASYSDTVPPSYALYNTETGQLNQIGSARPSIDPKQMGRQQMVHYKARDGLDVPALLTLPHGAGKNLPMVVLVHGGPWVHGPTWSWNPESQFLASRGYAVLEPIFRGSTGYGYAYFHAGWKQWGLAMQNDVADGTRWAIAKGIANPKRICIAGASYGGYATLMGLINDPDLYKCGVDWVGVTDINLMYNGSWSRSSDASDQWKSYGMPEMIGDQVKDAAQLKATSPIEQASRVTQPVLMAYGGVDRRVPLYHGQKFYDAVTKTNKNVEWIEYPEEGHGWQLPKNSVDFWGRVEKFLDKNIGPEAAAAK